MHIVRKINGHPLLFLLIILFSFAVAFASLSTEHVEKMGISPLFIFQVAPIEYWVAVLAIVCTLYMMFPHLNKKYYKPIFLFSAILLLTTFRMVFPVVFTSIPAYEPDANNYITILSSWLKSGVNFAQDGAYQHDYPFSFIVAYGFLKLGVPLDIFLRIAPFVIYALDAVFLYLIYTEVVPENLKKDAIPVLSVFLFSFTSLGYWITVHYCPDLFGSLMFLISLYFVIIFAKKSEWTLKGTLPAAISIYALILTHHLSTLYLIVTLAGFLFTTWFFRPSLFKKGPLGFFVLAIYTYTLWFAYGTLVYPKFFNIYVYFSGVQSPTEASISAGLLANISFAIYPLFIIGLFAIEFFKIVRIKELLCFRNLKANIHEIRVSQSQNNLLIFSVGFIFVFFLFLLGFVAPNLFGTRILEVLNIGLYPIACQTLLKYGNDTSAKKKMILLIIILGVVISGIYRYDTQIQRRVILG